jgi:hypothetical protein
MTSTRSNAKWLAKVVVAAAAVTACLASIARSHPPIRSITLGGHAIGESLEDFKTRLPRAVCGSRLHLAEILRSFPDENDVNAIGCCIDSPADLTAFSSREILFLGNCHVLAIFNHWQLARLRYIVDARSISELLPQFEKSYGPVLADRVVPNSDGTHPQRMVGWLRGDEMLVLSSITLGGDAANSQAAQSGVPTKRNAVFVHLLKLATETAAN